MIHKRIPYRIHQRNRIIKKRLNIMKNTWGDMISDSNKMIVNSGHLSKWNMSCNCWMCSKSSKTKYAGNKVSEKRKILREKDYDGL